MMAKLQAVTGIQKANHTVARIPPNITLATWATSQQTQGVVDSEVVYSFLTFDGENSILGKGVILHAKADDLTSQPTGAAGARIACGVITL